MKIKTAKPPGKVLLKQMPLRLKWMLLAPLGLLLLSAGVYTFGEAVHARNEATSRWIPLTIYGLLLINIGLVFFAQSIMFKIKMEYRREMRREIKKAERGTEYAIRKGISKQKTNERSTT